MQAQATRPDQQQDVMTAAQSLQSIQTLLRAGLGCITYLRNLLPTDNFSESYLTSAGADPQPSGHSYSGSFASDGSRRNVSGFKIMTVKRGYTEEADKLMDYLENGIFDALQKQYLRSFIFAIYLDNEDPNNIVEAYTFNFHYHLVPGSNKAIPVMTLGDELTKLSLSGKRREMDPVAEATRKGQVPTLGEVKRSLKTLIKNLIQATTQMDALPRRRYATFKLFYHDNTPDDYEPPHFRSGDAKEDKWFFSTHGRNEVPEKCSVGQVRTGWHGVDLRVASVSGYLPSAEDNDAPFMGTTAGDAGGAAPVLTPVEEAALRKQQVQAQRQDAEERRVVWDAEEGLADADADGEEDDGDDSQLMGVWRSSAGGVEYISPLGIRDDDGIIVPISGEAEEQSKDLEPTQLATEPTVFKGVQEKVPRHIGQLVLPPSNSGELSQTQKIDSTQPVEDVDQQRSDDNSPPSSPAPPTPLARRVTRVQAQAFDSESLPPSDPLPMSIPSVSSVPFDGTIDTQELKQLLADRQDVIEDAEMLDANTQLQQYSVDDDPIESFSASQTRNEDIAMGGVDGTDAVLDCECGVNEEDCDFLLCEGGCNKWFHAWCMGYHSGTSDTVPDKFICFDCRVHADQNWDLIMVHNLHPRMMAKFRDLALFRRAIKVCEIKNPESLSTFTKGIGCEAIVAGQVFKRLENEGFITLQDVEEPDAAATRGKGRNRGNRGGGKKTTGRRKAVIKQRYAFVTDIVNEKLYKDYFNPDPEVEKRLLGLDELRPKRRGRRNVVHDEDDDMYDAVSTTSLVLNALPLFHRETTETVTKTAANKAATAQLQEALLPAEPQGVSQTQPETQLEDVEVEPLDLKRHTSDSSDSTETGRKTKRVKISIGPAVDLGD